MKSILTASLFLLVFLNFSNTAIAQEDISEDKIRVPMINIHGALQSPSGDLADRFGNSSMFGGGFHLKGSSNYYWGVEGVALAGADVREDDILDIIKAEGTTIIDQTGQTASVRLWQRGAQGQFVVGKIFPVLAPNQNSGLFIQMGLGYMYHKIRIEDIGNKSPQLSSELLKGYDKLSMGFTSSQFIGYRYFSNNHKINFFFGIESIQAFTQDVRMYDYNAMESYEDDRLDIFNGIKFGWTFPLYKKSDNKYYYY